MRILCLTLLFLIPGAREAVAQIFTPLPQCVNVANSADHEILASLQTDQHTDANGKLSYHDFVFKLQAGERREVCSTGPFFPDMQLRLVLKLSFPVYSCKINVGRLYTITSVVDRAGTRLITADCPDERERVQQQAR